MDLMNNLLHDINSDFDGDIHITSNLQQGKAYRNFSSEYVNMVLPEVALMGGKLDKGSEYTSVTEPLISEFFTGAENTEIIGDDSNVNKSHGNKGRQNISSTRISDAGGVKKGTHFVGTRQERLDKSKQEEEYNRIEDEYNRLLSQYNREYETTLESLLKTTVRNKPVSPDLEKRVEKVQKLGMRLNNLAVKLEKRTDQLNEMTDKIKHDKSETSKSIRKMRAQHDKLSHEASKAGISKQDMQSLQGQYEDAQLMLTSHYYHYLMWTIVAITLIAFVAHVVTADNSNPINGIAMILILIAFLFVLRALYHYWSTHSIILR